MTHTRPDISFAVSVVILYMHDPRKDHMDAVYHILRYLKGAPGKGLILENMVILTLRAIVILIGPIVLMMGNPHQDTACLLGVLRYQAQLGLTS